MTATGAAPTHSKGNGTRYFSRRGFVTLLIMIGAICALGAYLLASVLPRDNQAAAELLVPLAAEGSANSSNVQTQIALLTSDAVLRAAADANGVPLAQLQSSVTAEQTATSQVIELRVRDMDGPRAVRTAGSILGVYREILSGSIGDQSSIKFLQNEIATLRKQLDNLDGKSAASRSLDSDERSLIFSRITALQTQLVAQQLAQVSTGDAVSIITPPYLQNNPVGTRPLISGIVGGFAGLALDALLLFLWLRRDGVGARIAATVSRSDN